MDYRTYFKKLSGQRRWFDPYGGVYLTEELIPAFQEVNEAYQTICHSVPV